MLIKALVALVNLIIKAIGGIGGLILMLLPDSPFQNINIEIPYLAELNWVIPFNFMINITAVWLVAVGLYYSVMIVLRWIKAIE